MHQKAEGGDKKFILTRLDKQLENVTTTLEKWKGADQMVSKLCGPENLNSKATCAAPLPTNGLVGFLSSTNNNSEWVDGYLYVNATITANTNFDNGLKCNGAGQGAKWPVDKDDKNQPYKFAEYGFTLLATVAVDENAAEGKGNSLLGILFNQKEKNNFGLWCTAGNKFGVSKGAGPTSIIPTETSCTPKTTYHVALILHNQLLVYINGDKLNSDELQTIKQEEAQKITHFYFGADTTEGAGAAADESHVGITNVLLYNRPFTETEITNLKVPKKNEAAGAEETNSENNASEQTKR